MKLGLALDLVYRKRAIAQMIVITIGDLRTYKKLR